MVWPPGLASRKGLMAEYGEWNTKGASLSEATAEAEYKVTRDFIIQGIRAGKLEYREASIWGNPILKILRSQLEAYIAEVHGKEFLSKVCHAEEFRKIKKEIAQLKKQLEQLELRKAELEQAMGPPEKAAPKRR